MIRSFKNFERLRYRISTDIQDIFAENKSNADNLREDLVNTIFSTIFSAFVTEVVFIDNFELHGLRRIICLILFFIFIYIISYLTYHAISPKISDLLKLRNHNKILEGSDINLQKQKDFDNIACDSILAAKGFEEIYLNLSSDKLNLKIFYYYESLHYLETACDKTLTLAIEKEKCIRTMDTALGVDIFRVFNALNLMHELYTFLQSNLFIITNNETASNLEAVSYRLGEVKSKIDEISNTLN